MAQIVTITNPLTGQPAQVDQLDHTAQQIDDAIARALPGGGIDTLLSGKAPAGYGLGTKAKLLTSDDNLDDIRANGFYGWEDSSPQNAVRSWSAMRVENNSYTGHVVQTCLSWNDNKSYSQLRRIRTDTGWLPWEYINPPMLLGVEYRTTERYKGKPVYVKAISFGTLPKNGVASVSDDFRGTNIVSVCGITSSGDYFPYYSGHTSSVGRIDIYANIYGNIWVTTTTDKSGETATIIVKYTKN